MLSHNSQHFESMPDFQMHKDHVHVYNDEYDSLLRGTNMFCQVANCDQTVFLCGPD